MSKNLKTGNAYNGINIFSLMHETRSSYFVSYKQAKMLGGQVRKGSKGNPIVYYSKAEKKERSATGEKQYFGFLKNSTVFSIADVEGIDAPQDEMPVILNDHERIERAESLFANWTDKPTLNESIMQNQGFYRQIDDSVNMPDINLFNSAEHYYGVLAHEYIHSTGAKKRLDRDLSGGMRSNSYSKEELVAELGACLIRAHCQIDAEAIEDNSIAYLQGWAKKLQNDPKMFQYAASQAMKAATYIIENRKPKE